MPAGPHGHSAVQPTHRRIGILSTYPPKLCGLATFAAALGNELRRAGNRVDIVRINDGDETDPIVAPVVGELLHGVPESICSAAALLSLCDVAIIQHEYGIFGGVDGDEVIELLDAVATSTVVVLHTVPLRPTAHQRSVLVDIGERADRVVVMSDMAHQRLMAYAIDPSKVVTIPHGASTPSLERLKDVDLTEGERPQLLTWGLLGPGKGIEHVIDALAMLTDLPVRPRYTIAGVTHPKVFAKEGDRYRQSLFDRAEALGVAQWVDFDDTYRDLGQLTRFVASATAIILPYDSRDQVTSGVLVDAIAAGRPVIATAFPHAVELLSGGAGIVVAHGDARALADAIRVVMTDAVRLASMEVECRLIAPSLRWSAVAQHYVRLSDHLIDSTESVAI